ncbi:MAG TPA: CBS domain-containing protein [Burkholderiales bacterium]|nr:CBS domain-containing protein [Burkholderiales bacterium]
MIVSMWMTREVATIEPAVPINEALALMVKRHVRRLPVVEAHDGGARLVGMVTATDIRRAYPSDVNPFSIVAPDAEGIATTTAEIMSRRLWTTAPDAPIEKAAAEMRERRIGALPVVRNGALVGLITESDIFRAFVAILHSPDAGARVTFDASRHEDVFGLIAEYARRHRVRVLSLVSAEQHDHPVCVVRLAGAGIDKMLDDLWASGHAVLNVLRLP